MSPAVAGNFAAITEPTGVGQLMRAIYSYAGHPCTLAALKLAPLVFVRPGELRTAEWDEIDLDRAEWRIPGSKMKMKVDHLVPLSTQAVEILRSVQPMTGHGRYVFPSARTGCDYQRVGLGDEFGGVGNGIGVDGLHEVT